MSEDLNASQGVPDGEPVAQPDTTAPEPGQGQPQEREAEAQPQEGERPTEQAKPNPPWFVTRLEKQRQQIEERDRRLAEYEARDRQQPQNQGQDQPQQPQSQADIDRLVNQRAVERIAQQEFDATCNSIHDAGTKAFPDFGDALNTLRHVGGLNRDLIEAAAETGDGAKVLYELGKNPDEAARIMALSPTRMAVAVAKLAAKPVTPPPVTKAPPPNKPVQGRPAANASEPDEKDVGAWIEKRNRDLSS